MIDSDLNVDDLKLRKLKSKELKEFFKYLFETGGEELDEMGVSEEKMNKFIKINRFLFNIPFKRFMKDTDIFVLEDDNEIIAGCSVSYVAKNNEYFLANVFTVPVLQGKGIGNHLLKLILSKYQDRRFRLYVNSKNEVAIHLYRKFGFEELSKIESYSIKLPFKRIELPKGYNARKALKSDIQNLKRNSQLPKNEDLSRELKDALNKTKKIFYRFKYELPVLLFNNNEIVGFLKAIWTKANPEVGEIITRGFLKKASKAYPGLISYLSEKVEEFGIQKLIWEVKDETREFLDLMRPYLDSPTKKGFFLVKNP